MKAWLLLIVTGAVVSLLLSAVTGDLDGWALLGGALFTGLMWALIVWREGETPASAWRRLLERPW